MLKVSGDHRGKVKGGKIKYDLTKKQEIPGGKVYVSKELLERLPELKKITVQDRSWINWAKVIGNIIVNLSLFLLKSKSAKTKDNELYLVIIEILYILSAKLKAGENG